MATASDAKGAGKEFPFLKSGAEFRESLRDGREVWYGGELVADVTTHPALAGGIAVLAEMYDDQLNPETQELVTFVRDDGARVSQAFMVPRSKDDLAKRRLCAEHFMRKTFGVFGRQLDMISTTASACTGCSRCCASTIRSALRATSATSTGRRRTT